MYIYIYIIHIHTYYTCNIYIYIYICYMYNTLYIHTIYIYIERERERDTYMYTYTHVTYYVATTLIYAIGAGITAAAGTRLALQSILVKGFKFYSFQLKDMDALYCRNCDNVYPNYCIQ